MALKLTHISIPADGASKNLVGAVAKRRSFRHYSYGVFIQWLKNRYEPSWTGYYPAPVI
jgi:hypothetical protein